MFNPERLLGQLMGQALGGQIGGRKKKRRSGFGLPSGGQAAVGLGLLGVAMAAYEHYGQKNAAPAAPQPAGGATGAVPPPPPLASALPPPPPRAAPGLGSEQAMHLLRAMITAAHADGLMDADEREAILGRAREAGLDPAELAALDAEMRAPFTLQQLAVRTPETLRADTYAAALLAITADTEAERAFLDQLAGQLSLDPATRRDLHARLGADD